MRISLGIKRLADLIGSIIGIILISPILIIISLAIKLTSKGPVLFKQERLGKDGRVFTILKFRTMVINAENIGAGIFINSESDPRITKIGRILRAASLDELPQLLNVIKGDMSLVGPRPPATYFPYKGYENYPAWAKPRFKMRPGITGLAQVRIRSMAPWDQRIVIDIEYIENFNIFMDIKIIIKTIQTVLQRKNIYHDTPGQSENTKNNVARGYGENNCILPRK
jgi:lipopolysaccharide/colanic/teichoic acid biosynthesis glycosyltransferase